MTNQEHLRKIPAVNTLLDDLSHRFPQIIPVYLKRIITQELDWIKLNHGRYKIAQRDRAELEVQIIDSLVAQVNSILKGSLKPVLNATGVVLHTGLGRAPVSRDIAAKILEVSRYCNLEINLSNGRRGQRNDHLVPLLRILTGAQDGLAVNNNAAAVMLMLNTAGYRKEVIISRGEMIEIGGSFRLPEVMRFSGCKLREIGTTNKTHLSDYETAIHDKTGAILICHPSNYEVQGFTEKPDPEEIVQLAHRHGIPVLYDLGSGALMNLGLPDSEPLVGDVLESGVDLVSFSGDKLLGGPQAGLIVGKSDWVQKCARNHLLRALRLDKFIIKLLQETLTQYLFSDTRQNKPDAVSALSADPDALRERCQKLVIQLPAFLQERITIVPAKGKVGSGAYPVLELDSYIIKLCPAKIKAQKLADRLRQQECPVFTYIEDDCVCLDLRTIHENEEHLLKTALSNLSEI